MDRRKRALRQVELAEAELAPLREEQVLRDLLATDEPSSESKERLRRLRAAVTRLTGKQLRKPTPT